MFLLLQGGKGTPKEYPCSTGYLEIQKTFKGHQTVGPTGILQG